MNPDKAVSSLPAALARPPPASAAARATAGAGSADSPSPKIPGVAGSTTAVCSPTGSPAKNPAAAARSAPSTAGPTAVSGTKISSASCGESCRTCGLTYPPPALTAKSAAGTRPETPGTVTTTPTDG